MATLPRERDTGQTGPRTPPGLPDAEERLVRLVIQALEQEHLGGLSRILAEIAGTVDAFGCILWEVGPGTTLDPPQGKLYVLAEWFEDKTICALHDLPLERSLTGSSILEHESKFSRDVTKDPRVFLEEGRSFLLTAQVKFMCAIPLHFQDGTAGAISVYGRGREPFAPEEVDYLERTARLVPPLYHTLRDRVSLQLVAAVKGIFDRMESRRCRTSKEGLSRTLEAVCQEVCDCFRCLEACVYLEDEREHPGVFKLMATTWPERRTRRSYSSRARKGLTAWVVKNGRSLKIFDLRHFERDRNSIRADYPGIQWDGLVSLEAATAAKMKGRKEEGDLPLSFMAAPIRSGQRTIGVIRCLAATEGPYYFAQRELELLALVGDEIAQRWGQWQRARAIEEENESWQTLVKSITDLNRFVYKELSLQEPDEIRIFDRALEVTQSVIRGAEITDVRLIDEKRKELYFATTYGDVWKKPEAHAVEQPEKRRFPIKGSSAGAHVVGTGEVYVIPDVTRKDSYYDGSFSETKRMIVAPISVEDQVFGVLDIRDTGPIDFPPHAADIAELLGKQLGLYHYLATTIRSLRQAEAELSSHLRKLEKMQAEQSEAYRDLAHQLRSPIVQAHQRIQTLLRSSMADLALDWKLRAIRGLCGKAKRVVMGSGLFVDLAKEEPIRLKRSRLLYQDLVRLLMEAAADAEIMAEPSRELRFEVVREGLRVVRSRDVQVDSALLEQAVSNLLDNAVKYSYSRTTVRISGGLTGTRRFHLTVASQGNKLRSWETQKVLQRAWRTEDARLTTGEGSGIGLWIVDNIMRAHSGEVIVVPTNPEGITEIKLVFPVEVG